MARKDRANKPAKLKKAKAMNGKPIKPGKQKKLKQAAVEKAQILSSVVVYDGPLFRVLHDKLIEPDGTANERDVIRHNGSVVILAIDNSKQKKDPWIVIERQYRHAANLRCELAQDRGESRSLHILDSRILIHAASGRDSGIEQAGANERPRPRARRTGEHAAADVRGELVHHVELGEPVVDRDETGTRIGLMRDEDQSRVVLGFLAPWRPAFDIEVGAVVV